MRHGAVSGTGAESGWFAVVLIVGGKGQGKLSYAMKKTGAGPGSIACMPEEAWEKPVFAGLETWLKEQEDPLPELKELLRRSPGVVILCQEVGCGVVPMERTERDWRERVGRVCCFLAERADRVERLCCGISTVLKGEGPWNGS